MSGGGNQRFTGAIINPGRNRQALLVLHNGIKAWLPHGVITRHVTNAEGLTEFVIPGWLYRAKFKQEPNA